MLWCLSVCKRRKHYCLVSPSTVWFVYDTALDGQRCCIVVVGATSVAVERLLRLLSVPLQQRSDSWRGRLLDNGATRHHTCYPACLRHHQSLRQPPRFETFRCGVKVKCCSPVPLTDRTLCLNHQYSHVSDRSGRGACSNTWRTFDSCFF